MQEIERNWQWTYWSILNDLPSSRAYSAFAGMLWLLIVAVKIPFNQIHILYVFIKSATLRRLLRLSIDTNLWIFWARNIQNPTPQTKISIFKTFQFMTYWRLLCETSARGVKGTSVAYCLQKFPETADLNDPKASRMQPAAPDKFTLVGLWQIFEKCLVFSNSCWVFCALESAALKKMSLNRKYSLQDCTGTKCWKGWIASWPLPTSFSEHDASTFPACNKHKESLCAKNPSSNFMLDFWEQVCDHLQGISEFILLTNNDLSFPDSQKHGPNISHMNVSKFAEARHQEFLYFRCFGKILRSATWRLRC